MAGNLLGLLERTGELRCCLGQRGPLEKQGTPWDSTLLSGVR